MRVSTIPRNPYITSESGNVVRQSVSPARGNPSAVVVGPSTVTNGFGAYGFTSVAASSTVQPAPPRVTSSNPFNPSSTVGYANQADFITWTQYITKTLDAFSNRIAVAEKQAMNVGDSANLVTQVGKLQGLIMELQSAVKNINDYTKNVGANADANFAAMDQQLVAHAQAITELSRSMVETFTPRNAVAIKRKIPRSAKGKVAASNTTAQPSNLTAGQGVAGYFYR